MTANAYRQLLDLLPDAPLQVGTAVTVDGAIVVVELPGGGRITARSAMTVTVGQRLFVRGDLIEGEAPALSLVLIDI